MREQGCAHIVVLGRVQGVGFRAFTESAAGELCLKGFSRNLPDGSVEIEVEGDREAIEVLIGRLRLGPPLARVEDLKLIWKPYSARFQDFSIRF